MQVITFEQLFFKIIFQLMEMNLGKLEKVFWGEGKDVI